MVILFKSFILFVFNINFFLKVTLCQQYLIYYTTTNKDYLTKYYSLYTSKNLNPKVPLLNSKNTTTLNIFNCTDPLINCYGNGICQTGKLYNNCTCNYGYTTQPGSYNQCGYKQKDLLTALLLESLVSFGIGHLYIGRTPLFIAKFLSFFFFYYFIFCIMIFIGSINESNVNNITVERTQKIMLYLYPIIYLWYLVDVIMFSMNKYVDNNQQMLLPLF